MEDYNNELMEAPEDGEVYDKMNDLTFGDDCYNEEEYDDWEAEHEKLAGVETDPRLDLNSSLNHLQAPVGLLGHTLPEELYYTGYVDMELEQKLNELVVDDDEDNNCGDDDDEGYPQDDEDAAGFPKSIPQRLINLDKLFEPSSPQGLFQAEDLVNGQANIWGSPAHGGYLSSLENFSGLPADQLGRHFPPGMFPGMMPIPAGLPMHPAGNLPMNLLQQEPSMLPASRLQLPGKAMTLEELEQQLLSGSTGSRPAAGPATEAQQQQQPVSLTAEEIEKRLKADLLGQNGHERDGVKGGEVVGGGDIPDLLRHPGILRLPTSLAQLVTYPNSTPSNTTHHSGINTSSAPQPPNTNLGPQVQGPQAHVGPRGFNHGPPMFPSHQRLPGNMIPPAAFFRQQQLLQQQQQQQHVKRQQGPFTQMPAGPMPHPMQRFMPPFYPMGVRGGPMMNPAMLRGMTHQQLQQLQHHQQLMMQQQHRQQIHQHMVNNNINMQRMKSHPQQQLQQQQALAGSFPLQQQQRFQQLQMLRQKGVASRQPMMNRGGDFNNRIQSGTDDEYAGLMEQREKDWIIKIQLLQLQTDNPYVDDYYYTAWTMKKIAEERLKKESSPAQQKSDAEPELLLPQLAKLDNRSYIPVQFEGSLGRLTTASIHGPRQMIDLHKRQEEGEGEGQGSQSAEQQDEALKRQEQRLLKLTLYNIEKGYMSILDIEDSEKKALALPQEFRTALNEKRTKLMTSLYENLKCDESLSPTTTVSTTMVVTTTPFVLYLNIRKGALLIARIMRFVTKDEGNSMLIALMPRLNVLFRKDWQDEVWPHIYQSISLVIRSADLSCLVSYIQQLTADKQLPVAELLQDKNLHNNIVSLLHHKLGVSVLVCLLSRGEMIFSSQSPLDLDANHQRYWRVFVEVFGSVLESTDKCIVAPSVTSCDVAVTHLKRIINDKQSLVLIQDKLTSIST